MAFTLFHLLLINFDGEIYIYIYIYIYILELVYIYVYTRTEAILRHFFFWIRENLISRKMYFVGPGEGVKLRLSQTLTRDARLNSNSRPAVQISNPLSSRYVS